MQNFITQSLRKATGIDDNKKGPANASPAKSTRTNNSPLSHMTFNNKWSYATLEYPYDIQTRTDLGHYMMFYINVPNETAYSGDVKSHHGTKKGNLQGKTTTGKDKFTYSVQGQDQSNVSKRANEQYSSPSFDIKNYEMPGRVVGGGSSPKKLQPKSQGTAAKLLGEHRTRRTSDAIVLYMPPQVGVNYASSYKESEIGAVAGATLMGMNAAGIGLQGFKNTMMGASSGAVQDGNEGNAPSNPFTAAADIYERKSIETGAQLLKLGDALGTLDKLSNQAVNNFLEAMFTGIGFRKFSYQYRFTPRDEQEAAMVDKIIRTFKFHMLPEYNKQESGRYFTVPSEFDIFYMYRGDENTWMNKIYTCVCTSCDINYSPNQFQTLRPVPNRGGAPMAEIEMKLDFLETKLVTKEDILEGY